MKILQIVTFVSVDSEFGGPSQVALNISMELNKNDRCAVFALSNSKTIQARWEVPIQELHIFRGFNLFSSLGFAGILNLRIFLRFFRVRKEFDIIHIHLARDLVTLPIAFMCMVLKQPYVLQTHGMIDPSKRKMARLLDFLVTKRVMRNSERILSLSHEEDLDLLRVESDVSISRFLNASIKRQSDTREDKVIFVGRISEDKRPDLLIEAAKMFLKDHSHTTFEFVGPDSGLLSKCKELVSESTWVKNFKFRGPLKNSETVELVSRSTVLVLPSPRDRFPLAVVESLSTGTPVVITHGNGLSELVSQYHAGVISELSENSIANSIQTIYDNLSEFQKNATKLFDEVFDLSVNARKLLCIYESILANVRNR